MAISVPPRTVLRRALSASVVLALGALLTPSARADTPAQAQQAIQAVVSRAAASYGKRDLSGSLAMYSPDWVARNVTGRKETFRQRQAALGRVFAARDYDAAAHGTVARVVLQGSLASTRLHWHYQTRHLRSASAPDFTVVRDLEEQTIWKKLPHGWQEIASDMTHDVVEYKR